MIIKLCFDSVPMPREHDPCYIAACAYVLEEIDREILASLRASAENSRQDSVEEFVRALE